MPDNVTMLSLKSNWLGLPPHYKRHTLEPVRKTWGQIDTKRSIMNGTRRQWTAGVVRPHFETPPKVVNGILVQCGDVDNQRVDLLVDELKALGCYLR